MDKWLRRQNKREIENWFIDNFIKENYERNFKIHKNSKFIVNFDVLRLNIKPINISVLFGKEYEFNYLLNRYLIPIEKGMKFINSIINYFKVIPFSKLIKNQSRIRNCLIIFDDLTKLEID